MVWGTPKLSFSEWLRRWNPSSSSFIVYKISGFYTKMSLDFCWLVNWNPLNSSRFSSTIILFKWNMRGKAYSQIQTFGNQFQTYLSSRKYFIKMQKGRVKKRWNFPILGWGFESKQAQESLAAAMSLSSIITSWADYYKTPNNELQTSNFEKISLHTVWRTIKTSLTTKGKVK